MNRDTEALSIDAKRRVQRRRAAGAARIESIELRIGAGSRNGWAAAHSTYVHRSSVVALLREENMLATRTPVSRPSELRTVRRNRSGVFAALTAGTVLMWSLFTTSSAHAATLHMCGHEIRTYLTSDGYVLIGSVSGVDWDNQRTDIVVWGMTSEGPLERTPVLAAMYAGVKFTWMYSRIAIEGHDQEGNCNVVLH